MGDVVRTLRLVALGTALGIGLLASACAAPVRADTVTTAKAAVTWSTCVPRAIHYDNAYRVDNDIFKGKKGTSCLSGNGSTFTIGRNYLWQKPDTVVAYPAIRFGPYYGSGDPQSGLPVRSTTRENITLHVASTGHSGGWWITDSDSWFFPTSNVTGHGNYELVIETRWSRNEDGLDKAVWRRVSAGHREWYYDSWITPGGWRLDAFRLVHETDSLKLRVGTFIWHARQLGDLPHTEYLANTAFGTECWSGCYGLTDALTVTGTVAR